MEKQEKVSRKIKNSLMHGNSGQLGVKKNDECYTSMQDILDEMSYWANLGKFNGKNIICPCDWDITDDENIVGITITYKDSGVDVVGNNVYKAVKEVVFDLWTVEDDRPQIVKLPLAEDEIEDFLRNKLTCNFIRVFTQNARRWGIKSITASGYNPANGKGIQFQDVDYTKYDICCTNPPFSLYKEFMNCILGNIDFIILAPLLNRNAPCCIEPIMLHKAFLGHGIELHMSFSNPTKENQYNVKIVNCDWITSYPEAQQQRNDIHYRSGISYELYKDEYVEMPNMTMKDGTHPIRVSMSTYPEDYDGWMFSTIGVLDNLDQSVYDWYCTNCKGYFNKNNMENSIFQHKADDQQMLICQDGKRAFHGILFKKKAYVPYMQEAKYFVEQICSGELDNTTFIKFRYNEDIDTKSQIVDQLNTYVATPGIKFELHSYDPVNNPDGPTSLLVTKC